MTPVETFKSFALLTFLIGAVAGCYMVWSGPRDKTKSVSAHAGTANKKLYILYALAFLISTVLFYLFCMFWFIPTLHLSFGFTLSLHVMTILLVLTAFIPQAGKKVKLHAVVAYGFAFYMMLLLFFVALSSNISLIGRIFSSGVTLWMISMWYLFFFSRYKAKIAARYLLFQSSYIILFFLSILAATYLR